MGLIRGQKVNAGEKWTLEFDVSSTAEREMVITAEDSAYTRYIDKKITVSPAEQHCSFDVTFENDMSVDLKFQLGSIGNAASVGAHDVTISGIKWEKS